MRELFELYWLRIPGVGARHLRVLGDLATAPTIDEAFHALRSRIRGDSSELDAFAPRTRWGREALAAARGDLDWLAANDVTILRPRDADFPPLLNEIPDPPPLLFVQGRPGTLHAHQVAIVGSRRASLGGREVARSLAQELARIGMVTTSGLARGIDVAAHRGALHGAGATVAVLGSGLRRVYPRENVRTSEEIRESGCLVTEFPPAMTPRPEHFPRRNRIISGLSLGVVVVEAAARSGSLITARLALEQGREVFAVPGSVLNPLTRGCHALLRQGARLVEGVEDVLDELPDVGLAWPAGDGEEREEAMLDADEEAMLEALGHDNVTADQLIADTQMAPAQAAIVLGSLEMKGFVRLERGGYIRCPSATTTKRGA